jgi:hypothetical protein
MPSHFQATRLGLKRFKVKNKLMYKKKFSLFAGLLVAIKTGWLSLS